MAREISRESQRELGSAYRGRERTKSRGGREKGTQNVMLKAERQEDVREGAGNGKLRETEGK